VLPNKKAKEKNNNNILNKTTETTTATTRLHTNTAISIEAEQDRLHKQAIGKLVEVHNYAHFKPSLKISAMFH